MSSYDYLVIGGGQVADNAARAIRKQDADGTILILSSDVDEPYTRPALSKKAWTDDDFDDSQIPLNTGADTGAEVRTKTMVTGIDRQAKQVTLQDGSEVGYVRLLLATGSEPQRIPSPDDERIIPFRTFADYRALRAMAKSDCRVVVVGGGYIGNEIAAALAGEGVTSVTLVFPQELLSGERFPAGLARRYEQLYTGHGVTLVRGHRAEKVEPKGDGFGVVLDDGLILDADIVVLGLGAQPRVELARKAGLEVDEGVVVDDHLRTADPVIWAAGDIAQYPDRLLGETRVEHIDNARGQGDVAGANMAGADQTYDHTPYFYSQVFGKRWEAVGKTQAKLDTLEVPLDDDREVVYYLEDSKPVGVLLWGVEDATDAARQVIADAPTDTAELRERIK